LVGLGAQIPHRDTASHAGPSTATGPITTGRFPDTPSNILDPALVTKVISPYVERSTQLHIYQYTAMCTACNAQHDYMSECNLQRTIIGINLDMPGSFSNQSIPIPTHSWGRIPWHGEPTTTGGQSQSGPPGTTVKTLASSSVGSDNTWCQTSKAGGSPLCSNHVTEPENGASTFPLTKFALSWKPLCSSSAHRHIEMHLYIWHQV
jgi:hypothetical protein